jgi:RNA polymerase sigma-70 factor (sigma-E family)
MTFEEFVANRLGALMRYAVVLAGDRCLAEDVVQDALVRAYERWPRIVATDQPEAYVLRMVTNQYLSWRRRWSRMVPRADVHPPDGDEPDDASRHAERDALRIRLDALPRRQRAVLVLRYYCGMSDTEIADALGCSHGTVRGYASRALSALRIDGHAPAVVKE